MEESCRSSCFIMRLRATLKPVRKFKTGNNTYLPNAAVEYKAASSNVSLFCLLIKQASLRYRRRSGPCILAHSNGVSSASSEDGMSFF